MCKHQDSGGLLWIVQIIFVIGKNEWKFLNEYHLFDFGTPYMHSTFVCA